MGWDGNSTFTGKEPQRTAAAEGEQHVAIALQREAEALQVKQAAQKKNTTRTTFDTGESPHVSRIHANKHSHTRTRT
jgi:hypothetical protein